MKLKKIILVVLVSFITFCAIVILKYKENYLSIVVRSDYKIPEFNFTILVDDRVYVQKELSIKDKFDTTTPFDKELPYGTYTIQILAEEKGVDTTFKVALHRNTLYQIYFLNDSTDGCFVIEEVDEITW